MAFATGTKLMTRRGFIPIEDITPKDDLLLRNFLGFATFERPISITKRKPNSRIITFSGSGWDITVTPEHEMLIKPHRGEADYIRRIADDVYPNQNRSLVRKVRYDTGKAQTIRPAITRTIERQRVHIQIEPQDWMVILGYHIAKGTLHDGAFRKLVRFNLNKKLVDRGVEELGGVLDKYGIEWGLHYGNVIAPGIKTTLASVLSKNLTSIVKDRYRVSERIIFDANQKDLGVLVDSVASCFPYLRGGSERVMTTRSEGLAKDLEMIGTLANKGVRYNLHTRAGEDLGNYIAKENIFAVTFTNRTDHVTIKKRNDHRYMRNVYELSFLEGQVYAKNKKNPIWIGHA